MSSPNVTRGKAFWDDLIELNKRADALVARVLRAKEPTEPISREVPAFVSIEARFDGLFTTYANAGTPNSDALDGNNVRRPIFQNNGSRLYIRELGFQSSYVVPTNPAGVAPSYDARIPNEITNFPFNWRWNFMTSITQRWYNPDRRCLANAGGRSVCGTHLSFREPLIIEPMEVFTFECEMLGGFGMDKDAVNTGTSAIVAMLLHGYREGV